MDRLLQITILAAVACGGPPALEDPDDWFDPGTDVNVEEALAFTDQPYDFPADDSTGIGTLLDRVYPVSRFMTAFGPDDSFAAGVDDECDQTTDTDLPFVIEGIVTLHPDFYFKTTGCYPGDEKYYGSYFIQDRTGGIFVLGDSKVAHFDMGDRVTIRVRAARSPYDLNMVYAHDVLEVERGPEPIFYETPAGALGDDHVGRVQRVVGTVQNSTSTFGEFQIKADNGAEYDISLDSELNRRGISFDLGTRIQVTGPVIYSYSAYAIVVIRVGQIEVLD